MSGPSNPFRTKFVQELFNALVKCVRETLTCFGYGSPAYRRSEKEKFSIEHIKNLLLPLDDGDAVAAVKYLTAVYLPKEAGDPVMPKRPEFLDEHSTLFKGEYGHFVDRILRGVRKSHHKLRTYDGKTRRTSQEEKRQSEKDLAISLSMSILQLKRGMPPLPETLQLKAREDLKVRLTTPARTPRRLIDEVVRTTNELYPPAWDCSTNRKGRTVPLPIPRYVASRASCVQNGRSKGGIQGFVFDRRRPSARAATSTLIGGFQHKAEHIIRWGLEKDLPMHSNSISQEEFEDLALRNQPEKFRACVEVVEDPLKARVITKNEWVCQILKPLQKMMHNRLRKHPAFRLIGETISVEVIATLCELFQWKGVWAKWVSGDYSAATDNFHSDVTEAAIEVVLQNMRGHFSRVPEFQLLAKKSLTGLTIWDDVLGEEYTMARGQLMGSLLSFIILCVVNFAVWRHSAEQAYGKACDGKGMGGVFDHVLINGDDIGFAATPHHYELWKELVPQVGLSPSAGKNYFSSDLITLNTRVFRRNAEGWYHVPFVNVGLLGKGHRACHTWTNQQWLGSLGQMHDDFVAGAEFKGSASAIFISNWKPLLKTTMRNLFGPREYGGLGAHPVPGSKGSEVSGYNYRQLLVAQLLKDGKIVLPSTGISPLYEQYERAFLLKKFGAEAMEKRREEDLPPLPMGYRWKDVTPQVEDAESDFRCAVSWMAPSGDVEKPHRDLWNKVRKFSLRREYKASALMRIDEYLSWDFELKYHFKSVYDDELREFQELAQIDSDYEAYAETDF